MPTDPGHTIIAIGRLYRLLRRHRIVAADAHLQLPVIAFGERNQVGIKRVFGLVIDFGTSQSPKSTRPLTTYLCPSRPGHPSTTQQLRKLVAAPYLAPI
ncbi:hypothetical protein [Thiolapillus sp.]|uniref:hypothetical protein n=1 Tax=Thiolapillus sp. TaxID=2017437 RepID=UPI0025F166E3|nr:hypothetical protein [Thiolapillus sp.]